MDKKQKYLKNHVFDPRDVRKTLTGEQNRSIRVTTYCNCDNIKDFKIYGSLGYRSQTYPSDIDGTEQIIFCKDWPCSRDKAEDMAVQVIKTIVEKILNSKDTYLGDIKIGVDSEVEKIIYHIIYDIYDKNINKQFDILLKSKGVKYDKKGTHIINKKGYISDKFLTGDADKTSEYSIPQLLLNGYDVTYPKDEVLQSWEQGYSRGIISKESLDTIKKLIPNKLKGIKGIKQLFTYCEFIRNLYILRWSGEEVLTGIKLLGSREITLKEAVTSSYFYLDTGGDEAHLIKVDMFANINGKIMEFSNLLSLGFNDSKYKSLEKLSYTRGEKFKDANSYINDLTKDESLIDNLSQDLIQYYYELTDKTKKPMKFAKRTFVLAILHKNKNIGVKLAKLFKSDINLLNNINTNIDIVLAMLSDQQYPPIDVLFNQLEEQKFRISQITDFEIDQNKFYDIIDNIIKSYRQGSMTILQVREILKKLHDGFGEIVNNLTRKYLLECGLWPGPYVHNKYLEFIYG